MKKILRIVGGVKKRREREKEICELSVNSTAVHVKAGLIRASIPNYASKPDSKKNAKIRI